MTDTLKPGLMPLRGRDGETAVLRARLSELVRGRGSVVIVDGGAGLGKTRLLGELETSARRMSVDFRRGAADPAATLVPLGALLGPLTARPEPLMSRDALRLADEAPSERYWLLEEIQDVLEKAALRRPLVIAIDDAHYADALTHLALRTLPVRLSTHAIFWVLAFRPHYPSADAALSRRRLREAGATVLELGPLGDDAALEIAEAVLGGTPDSGLRDCVRSVHGRPFELGEMLRGYREEGSIRIRGTTVTLEGRAAPATYHDAIRQRLDGLTPAARDLIRAVAVLGRGATADQIAAFFDASAGELLGLIAEAQDADILVLRGDRFEFRHDLIREAVEAALPGPLRQGLLRRVLESLKRNGAPVLAISELVFELARPGDSEAIEVLRRAAAELAATAPGDAARLSDRALEIAAGGSGKRAELLIETIRLRWRAGRPREAGLLATEALSAHLMPDAEAMVRLEFAALSTQYSFLDAIRQCRLGLDRSPPSGMLRARLHALLALSFLNFGSIGDAAGEVPRAIAAARHAQDPAAEVLAVACNSTISWYQGKLDRARSISAGAIALADQAYPAGRELWTPEIWHVMVLSSLGCDQEAIGMADAGVRHARQAGEPELLRYWVTTRSRLLLDAGQLDDARAEAEAAMAMADDLGPGQWTEATTIYTLSRLALLKAGAAQSLPVARHARQLASSEPRLLQRAGHWLAALDADARNDHAGVEEHTRESAAAFGAMEPILATWHDPTDGAMYVRICLRAGLQGRAESASRYMQDVTSQNPQYPLLAAVAAHGAALLGSDPSMLRRAITLYAQTGRRASLASAHEDLARSAGTTVTEAVEQLRTALELCQAAGFDKSAARLRQRLRDLGVQQPRSRRGPGTHGWADLTPSQLDVVRLVAAGATNRVVARELFLSPHTVNSHLRHAFAKLGIRSRVDLARLVTEAQLDSDPAAR